MGVVRTRGNKLSKTTVRPGRSHDIHAAIWFGRCDVYVRRLPSSGHVLGAFPAEAEDLGGRVAFQLNHLRNSRKAQSTVAIQRHVKNGLLLGR